MTIPTSFPEDVLEIIFDFIHDKTDAPTRKLALSQLSHVVDNSLTTLIRS